MYELICSLAAVAGAYIGFLCLALAMGRHWRDMRGASAGGRVSARAAAVVGLRIAAVIGFALSLAMAVLGNGPTFGSVLWVVSLSLAAFGVVATLAAKPAWLQFVAAKL